MNAAEIIAEIQHLPPMEKDKVVQFVRTLDPVRPWTPSELNEASNRLAEETDPTRAAALKERIVAGFYGDPDA